LKEAIKNKKKTKTKKRKPPGKDNLKSELYKHTGDSFYERILFFKQHF